MAPQEVLVSESQERMLAVVRPAAVTEVLDLCGRWGVPATVVGEVTATGRLVVTWHGRTVCDVPPASLADDGPVYERPLSRPADQDRLVADEPTAQRLLRPRTGAELRATLLRMIASPELCARSWITDQYDRYVQGNTVLAQPEDAGVVRLDEDSGLGVALALDGNGRFARLDPYAGTQLALAEAWRNVAVTGARPLAVTDCLNFGSPEDPAVMWQFAEAVRGLAEGCAALELPVTGGNVSFYNSTGATAINPTPVVGVLGVLDDVTRRTPMGFATEGEALLLLGSTREEFGGSAWAHVEHGHLGGRPPRVELGAERRLAEVLIAGSRDGVLSAAHDLSEGGLAQALVESCLRGGWGSRITLPAGVDPFVALFAESAARVAVAVAPAVVSRFTELCGQHGVPVSPLGVVGGDDLDVEGLFRVPLSELRTAYEGTFPRLFG